jgi:GTPase
VHETQLLGKSTLIGTLISSTLDDGKGSNRTKVATHQHEVLTGRTSTISSHLMGYDSNGYVVHASNGTMNEAAIAAEGATKTISFMDLAGHEKYFRKTVAGVSRGMADYALIVVNANQGLNHMTMKHLQLCILCGIPVIVVLTKLDTCPTHVLRNTRNEIRVALRTSDVDKRPFAVQNKNDIETVKYKMHSLAPIIETSCVTGFGLDILLELLRKLPRRRTHEKKIARPFEFLIEDQFTVPGSGFVISGFVNSGQWQKGDRLNIGPLGDGTYVKTSVKSAQVARTSVSKCWAGHTASFAISMTKDQRRVMKKRKGMVAVKEQPISAAVRSFTADICLLRGEPVTMVVGTYQTMAHILHLRKIVQMVNADLSGGSDSSQIVLRPGLKARVTFRFVRSREYVRTGMRVILRDGYVRGIGFITSTNDS